MNYVPGIDKYTTRKNINLLIALTGFLILVYMPVLVANFSHHDDYFFFSYDTITTYSSYHMFGFVNLIGRQLYGILSFGMSFLIEDISDLVIIRSIGLLLLILSAFLLLVYLLHLGLSRFFAFSTIILIVFLPGFQSGIFWASMAPLFVALLMSMIAGILVQNSLKKKRVNLTLFFSSLILTSSLFIHPSWAMIFFTPFIAFLLFDKNKQLSTILRVTFLNYIIFSLACITYFVLHKFVLLEWSLKTYPHLIEEYHNLDVYKFELSSNPILKLIQLFSDEFYKLFSLWDIYQEGWSVIILITTFFLSFILYVVKKILNQKLLINEFKTTTIITLIFSVTFVATLAPYILAQNGHTLFRIVLPSSILLTLLFMKNLEFITHNILMEKRKNVFLYGIVLSFSVFVSYTAHKNVKYSVQNSVNEFSFIKSLIFNHVNQFGLPSHIHLVRSSSPTGFNGLRSFGDTINFNSTTSLDQLPWIIRAALITFFNRSLVQINPVKLENFDPGDLFETNHVVFTSSTITPLASKISPNTLLIDMRNNLPNEFKLISYPFASSRHSVYKAFDGSMNPDDFWETSILEPVMLDFKYPMYTTLTNYVFSAGEIVNRMPTTWKLLASNNKEDWVILDEHKKFASWEKNSSQKFAVQQEQPTRYYRFIFEKALHSEIMRIYEIKLEK